MYGLALCSHPRNLHEPTCSRGNWIRISRYPYIDPVRCEQTPKKGPVAWATTPATGPEGKILRKDGRRDAHCQHLTPEVRPERLHGVLVKVPARLVSVGPLETSLALLADGPKPVTNREGVDMVHVAVLSSFQRWLLPT